MKVLYISSTHTGMHSHSIYFDLMQEFKDNGHDVTIAYAREKRLGLETEMYFEHGLRYLGIKTGNISKNKNMIEKGIVTLTIDSFFKNAIKKHLGHESFDLILYSTPPITFIKTVAYLKRQSPKGKVYLMLKDIFPQNAVDMGLFSENGPIHKFFRRKEKKLYASIDLVGVMSPRNKAYFIEHNPEYEKIVDILPNAIKVMDREFKYTRKDFGLDDHKTLFIYGGNLGIPQNIPYLIMCARAMEKVDNVTLVVCGSGGKQDLIESYIAQENPKNFVYLGQLPKDKYDEIVHHCDVGLIFLDERFTIPNYPQRVLSYLQAKLPIISATDSSTDVGSMAEENGYGYSVMSPDVDAFIEKVKTLSRDSNLRETMGEKGYQYLLDNFTVNHAYKKILNQYYGGKK